MQLLKIFLFMITSLTTTALLATPTSNTWETSISLGGTLTDGNSETFQLNTAILAEKQYTPRISLRAGINGNYGENQTDKSGSSETTIANVDAFANIKKTVSQKRFYVIDAMALHDDIASIDYRIGLSTGLGIDLIKEKNSLLSLELGPAYLWEKVEGKKNDYPAFRANQRYEQALSASAKIWQSLEYIPVADDFSDYLLNTEFGVESSLTHRMNLQLIAKSRYDNIPADGAEKHDLTFIARVALKL